MASVFQLLQVTTRNSKEEEQENTTAQFFCSLSMIKLHNWIFFVLFFLTQQIESLHSPLLNSTHHKGISLNLACAKPHATS